MLLLCFLPHNLVRFSVSQNCDSFKLWLLYFFLLQLLCAAQPTCTAVNSSTKKPSFWRLSIEFRHLCGTFSGRAALFPALVISCWSKAKKTDRLQTNAANSKRAGVLLEFLCLLSVARGVPEAPAPGQWTKWSVSPWGCCSPTVQWWFSCEPFALLICSMIFLVSHFWGSPLGSGGMKQIERVW